MVEHAAVATLYAAFQAAQGSGFSELAAVYDDDHLPVQDWDYPAVSVEWDDTGTISYNGNMVEGETYLMVSLYEADGHPPDAHRRLRSYLRKFSTTILSCRAGTDGGFVFTYHPGPIKPGQRLGGGTHTAAAFCRVTVKFRGPL